ncbi:MAG: YcaO-like family protein, partial [Nitrososphaerales archaeon]
MLSKPIFFRKRAYSAQKSFFAGTHRILSPEETWEKIAPLAKKIGVTRVSNITGLDRVGIPVTLAIRPGTQTLVTSSGKGISYISALVSGLMEALEIYCAEETELPFLHLSYNELITRFPAPDLSDFHYRKASLFHPDWKERWSLGWDLVRQEEFAVPTLCVTMNPRFNAQEKTELFS